MLIEDEMARKEEIPLLRPSIVNNQASHICNYYNLKLCSEDLKDLIQELCAYANQLI
jgi:hypothetical protein